MKGTFILAALFLAVDVLLLHFLAKLVLTQILHLFAVINVILSVL